jgi:DNA-directed RNA polymerase subunit RPC12/RpoP
MGFQKTYKCSKCEYTTLTAGGRTRGFEVITDSFVCNQCKEIVDIVIDNVDEEFIHDWTREAINREIVCPKCNSLDIKKWDVQSRICPKCNSEMEVKLSGEFIYWD